MARNIKEILEELFKGRDAALEKYAKVRYTQYELSLWRGYGLPLSEVASSAKLYFSKRFLKGQRIDKVSREELNKAYESLGYAVSNGCKTRCTNLIKELNEALRGYGLEEIKEIDKFLDWLTFNYTVAKDYDGRPKQEPGYSFEIRMFDSDQIRKEFWTELQSIMKTGRIMSMHDVARITIHKRKHSKSLD